jgi:hypothetical protein
MWPVRARWALRSCYTQVHAVLLTDRGEFSARDLTISVERIGVWMWQSAHRNEPVNPLSVCLSVPSSRLLKTKRLVPLLYSQLCRVHYGSYTLCCSLIRSSSSFMRINQFIGHVSFWLDKTQSEANTSVEGICRLLCTLKHGGKYTYRLF